MNHGSLFTGLGVIDFGLELLGWKTIFQVEQDKWLRERLGNVFKDTEKYGDIKIFDGTKYRGTIDLISGGDPCQPSSVAGQRKGKADDRYLWPEMFRCIKEIRPGWVFNENVTGTISNEILDQKISNLESEGYTCWPPLVIPASAVGAPHQRYRCFLIAYSNRSESKYKYGFEENRSTSGMSETEENKREWFWNGVRGSYAKKHVAYSIGKRDEISNERKFTTEQLPGSNNQNASDSDEYNGNLSRFYSTEIQLQKSSEIQSYTYDMCKQVIWDYEERFQSSFAGFSWGTNWHDVASEFCRVDDGSAKGLDKGHRLKALGNGIVLPQILEILCYIDFLQKQLI